MKIRQIISASDWYAKVFKKKLGKEIITPVACWALVSDDIGGTERVVGMIDDDGLVLLEPENEKFTLHYYCLGIELSREERIKLSGNQ